MEMLIVLGILVVVFALAAPRFFGAREKADKSATKSQILLFGGALEKYVLDTRGYPTTEQGLQALLSAPAESDSEEGEGSVSNWDGPYINKPELPKDPWGHDYQYAYPSERTEGESGQHFPDIWSWGPDGEDNTEDDICSWVTSQEGEGELGGDMAAPDRDVDVRDVSVGGGEDEF